MLFSYEIAKRDQEEMSNLIIEESLYLGKLIRILGLDVSYRKEYSYAVAVVYNTMSGIIEEVHSAILKTKVPYVPGFLGFREIASFMATLQKINLKTIDLILVDGHGRFHPRMAGSASHVYLVVKRPTIGVAKNPLRSDEIDSEGNIWLNGKIVGKVLSHPMGARKLYVSVGGGIDLETAYNIVKKLRKNPGLPIPLNYADKISKKVINIALSGS
ncbi:MAG: endonuclease V [Fervidicoccaceae archaeon]